MWRRAIGWLTALFLTGTLWSAAPDSAHGQPKPTDKQEKPDQPKPAPKPPPAEPPERRPPAPEYALAFLAVLLILVIVCKPTRKNV
jgi:hypothetical protein